jgi:hypothetical protein
MLALLPQLLLLLLLLLSAVAVYLSSTDEAIEH